MHPPVRLVAIDVDGTLLASLAQTMSPRTAAALRAAQQAGITVAIATGRRTNYTTPVLDGHGLGPQTFLITSNGALTRTLGGELFDQTAMPARTARGLCSLLRPFGALIFTFERADRAELVLEDIEHLEGRIALWIEANRNAIEVVRPLESALVDGADPIQGMVAGTIEQMRAAQRAIESSECSGHCESVRTEYPARNLSILDLLPHGVNKASGLRQLALRLGIDRKAVMAIGDNWNDAEMLEWAGQPVLMGNAAPDLKAQANTLGWRQAPTNDQDGVAVVLERELERQRKLAR